MKISVLVATMLLGVAPAAFAADRVENEISYDDALAKCAEFVNDPQIVTIEFKVGCFDETVQWKEIARSDAEYENYGNRGHKILMKEKWSTPHFSIPVVQQVTRANCPVLGQFMTTREASVVLSCEDFVNNFQGPVALAERCDTALAEAAPQTEATGEEVNPCGARVID